MKDMPIVKYALWIVFISLLLMVMFRVICINPLIENNSHNTYEIYGKLGEVENKLGLIRNALDFIRVTIRSDTMISNKIPFPEE